MSAYYNEIDPFSAEWLRRLIAEGLIPAGEVDERSIIEVTADDLRGFRQAHFFAGIGGWPLAARLAGWPDDRPLWTGSCPCQPFSVAGPGRGTDDERHLWPAFAGLIAQCRPAVVAGEQVASKAGRSWLAGVRTDLEALGYGVGAADLCAAGVGAPHIRQRLYWVAEPDAARREGLTPCHGTEGGVDIEPGHNADGCGVVRGRLADTDGYGTERIAGDHAQAPGVPEAEREPEHGAAVSERDGEGRGGRRGVGGLGEAIGAGLEGHTGDVYDGNEPGRLDEDEARSVAEAGDDSGMADGEAFGRHEGNPNLRGGHERGGVERPEHCRSPWDGAVWIPCADGKARRIEPSIEPLAHGVPGRVGRVRAYGNAIVPELAATFLEAWMDTN